jgi:hypothetical protein
MTSDGGVIGVLGQTLAISDCPKELQPFMRELAAIGKEAVDMEEEDTRNAMTYAQNGQDIPPPRLERVKKIFEEGIGHELESSGRRSIDEDRERRRSVEGRAVAFSNRINGLSLALTRLRAFRERQDDVFKVLSGI